jgi:hypothetical protein
MLSFEVKTEIRFIPNDEKFGGVEPDVKAKVRVKRGKEDKETEETGEEESAERSRSRRRRLTFGGGRNDDDRDGS